MGKDTRISWCDHTFNPVWGCTRISPGCQNCYAESLAKRWGKDLWGNDKPRQRTSAANWRQPLAWDKAAAKAGTRARVFCGSMCDWIDHQIPIEVSAELLELIAETPHLDWLLLTKRPEFWRIRMETVESFWANRRTGMFGEACRGSANRKAVGSWLDGTPPPNVWVGCTVEDQRRADERIPALLSIPARVRFLSCEPLLEAVDLTRIDCDGRGLHPTWCQIDPLTGRQTDMGRPCRDVPSIDWVIVGGESGPKARPFDLAWARSIRDQCQAAGVPVFVKQLGARPVRASFRGSTTEYVCHTSVPLSDRAGADPAEWPEDLRVQQWPEVQR